MHLFSKENKWSNPQQFPASCIHSNNNSVDRIISKEEEREDPRRDSSIYLRVQSTVVFPQFYKNYSVPHAIQQFQDTSTYRINSSPRNTTTTRLIPCRSVQGSFKQLFAVSPSILHGRIRLPAPLQHSRAIQHKQASSNSTR